MHPSKFTQKLLESWGGEEIFAQALALAKKGAVERVEMRGGEISGIIRREGLSEIYSRFTLNDDGTISSHCPCVTNRRDGRICAHVVALGAMLMMRYSNPEQQRRHEEERRHALAMERAGSAASIRRAPDGIPARLCLSLADNWIDSFHSGGPVAARVLILPTRGGAPMTPESLHGGATLRLTPEDENLLSVLEDIGEGTVSGRLSLSPANFLDVIRAAAGVRIVVGGKSEWRVERTAVPAALMVNVDEETGELFLFPKADVPNMPSDALPKFLAEGRRAYVAWEGHIHPLANVLPPPYHPIYIQDQVIPRSRVINFLERDLPNLRQLAPTALQIGEDLFQKLPGEPTFELEVCGSRASLRAELFARYGEDRIPAGIADAGLSVAVPDPDDILLYRTRNRSAETTALRQLLSAGFHLIEGQYVVSSRREVLNILGSGLPSLARIGWHVHCTPDVEAIQDSTPLVTPVVKIDGASEEWFDVGYDFEANDGSEVPAAEVQRAINCGDSFIERNGKTYLLDSDAVNAMRAIFDDCRCREGKKPGHFRMPQIYAPFIHSSLQALDGADVDMPPDWRDRAKQRNRDKETRFEPVPLGDGLEDVLRPYQKDGVYWMRFLEKAGMNGLLADEMGLGKTLQTLTWLSLERVEPAGRGKPALVVCPTSLVENWAREAQKFLPRLKVLVIDGPNREKLFDEIPRHDLVITSYALVRRDMEHYDAQEFSAAVIDEAQHIKNRTTQNALAVKRLRAHSKLALTGTPIENGVADVWSIMDFLMPEYLGVYDDFHVRYEEPLKEDFEGNAGLREKLRRKLHPFILRRVKKDVAKDLPDKITDVRFCAMTPDQRHAYETILAEYRSKIRDMVRAKGFDKSRFEILAMLTQLRQICCHLHLRKDHRPRPGEEPSAKANAFFELLEEALAGGHRMLVFSQFVSMLKILAAELEQRGISFCYLDGQTDNRLEQCEKFNRTPSIPVFLISLKAGGTGLNLTGADMVVHFDPWWNPAAEDQATDRAHRIGQKKTVHCIKFIAEDSVEERVLEMQRRKQELINATINTNDQTIVSKLSFDDVKALIGL